MHEFIPVERDPNMARPKKNGTYLNVCIDTPVYNRLAEYCKETGQPKTVAVERALMFYLNDYEEKQRMLKELEKECGNGKR